MKTTTDIPRALSASDLFGFPELVANVKPGDRLINAYDQQAEVIELLPDDPEYFARLRTPDGEEFAALAENFAAWRPDKPNATVEPPSQRDEN